jgi:GNAT superfamily N-acetyltransferase
VIRAARPADADALAALEVRAWEAAYGAYVSPEAMRGPISERPARWRDRLGGAQDGVTLVLEGDAAVEGFASAGPTRVEDGAAEGAGELYALYVEPALVGTGRGRALLEAAEELLVREHAEATLWVLEPNAPARAFYERHGWREDDRPYDRDRWGWAPSIRYRKRLR